MQCPACSNALRAFETGAITVDVCENGCGGMWFDQLELARLDEPHEAEGEALLDINVVIHAEPDPDQRRNCPKCEEQKMLRFFYSPTQHVEVDHCPDCGGHWLDVGELAEVRSLYSSPGEREEQMEILIQGTFGTEIAAMENSQDKVLSRPRNLVRRLMGFLMPL